MFFTIKIILSFFYREYKVSMSGFYSILTNIIFFLISIFIFIFSIGPDKTTLSLTSIGILWSLLILSSTLTIRKFYHEDFETGNLVILHLSGLSYEFISILKILSHYIFVQIPFLLSIPIGCILLSLTFEKTFLVMLSFSIGAFILSCLGSISASMNLLNNRNYSLGSVIILTLSIPIVIFSIGIINSEENFNSLINILFGILLILFSISPWASAACLRLALKNS